MTFFPKVVHSVFWRAFTAIFCGLFLFSACLLPAGFMVKCVRNECNPLLLPLAFVEGVIMAPFLTVMAVSFVWPVVSAALCLAAIFPRPIDKAPVVWTAAIGVVAWLVSCAIIDSEHRRRDGDPSWWFERALSSDGILFAIPVLIISTLFLYLTPSRDART